MSRRELQRGKRQLDFGTHVLVEHLDLLLLVGGAHRVLQFCFLGLAGNCVRCLDSLIDLYLHIVDAIVQFIFGGAADKLESIRLVL